MLNKKVLLLAIFLIANSVNARAKTGHSTLKSITDDIDSINNILAGHTRLVNSLRNTLKTLQKKQSKNMEDIGKISKIIDKLLDQKKKDDTKVSKLQKKVQELSKRGWYKGKKIPILIPHAGLAVRPEFATNLWDLDSSKNDKQSWVDQRVRLGAEFHPFKVLDMVVTIQDTRRWGDSGGPDRHFNGTDLYNGYIVVHDFGVKGLGFKLGRMQLNFGSGRVIGNDVFSISGRAFDAALVRYAPIPAVDITAMASILRENGMPSGKDRNLFGLYYTGKFLNKRLITDAYGFYLEDGKPSLQLKLGTFGVRVVGEPIKNLLLEAEASLQTGKKVIANTKHTQFAAAYYGSIQYTFGGVAKPGLGLLFSSASGDANPYDNRDVSYMPMYPSKFKYWGKMDMFNWSGVVDGGFEAHVGYKDKFLAYTAFHAFFLAANGGIVNMAGKDVRFPANKGRTLGYEWDLLLRYNPWKFMHLDFAYGLFAPGSATKAAFNNHSNVAHALYFAAFLDF